MRNLGSNTMDQRFEITPFDLSGLSWRRAVGGQSAFLCRLWPLIHGGEAKKQGVTVFGDGLGDQAQMRLR